MRFFEVDSAVDAIMSAAMVAQGRASQQNKQGKLSMNGFLQMLANSDVVMDYDGFKTVFDTNPALQNVIAKFDKDTITFKGDSDDEGEGYEEPETDIPDDERVSKMAKRAMKTREFVEDYEVLPKMDRDKYQKRDGLEGPIMTRSGKVVYYDPKKGDYYDPDTDMYLSYDDYKMLDKKANEATITEFDRHQDIIDQIVDMQPETSNEIIRMAQKLGAPDKAIDDILQAVLDKVNIDEAELPPHLSKMFGKDGKQVDTRTDVMRQMRDIVANKQASKVKFGDGDQMIDMYTASVLTQIYDKVNDNSKEAIIQRIGTKEKFAKLMPKLFSMLGEGSSPHPKGSKKYKAHMAAMHAGESVNEAWQAFKERSLTKAEKSKMKHYEKKLPKQDFIDRYGKKEGEAIYYATATKMAKKNA